MSRPEGATEYSIRDHIFYGLNVTHEGYWSSFDTKITATYDNSKLESPTDSFTPEVENIGLTGYAVTYLGDHTLTIGADVRQESQSIGNMRIEGTEDVGVASDSVIHSAVFIEDSWYMSDAFTLTSGARYNHNSLYGGNVTPRIYGVWTTSDKWVIKGGVSTGYRSPELKEISPEFGTPQNGGATTWGNPDLEPETSVNTEISFNYNSGESLRASFTLFNTTYKNKITNSGSQPLDTDGDGITGDLGPDGNLASVYLNIAEATLRGVEFTSGWDISDTVKTRFDYTYTKSEVNTAGQSVNGLSLDDMDGGSLVNTPEHLASFNLDWQASENVSTYLKSIYRGNELTAIKLGGVPTIGSDTTGDSLTFDLGLSWTVIDDLTLSAYIYNLTDEINFEEDEGNVYQYIEDGRRYWVSASYEF